MAHSPPPQTPSLDVPSPTAVSCGCNINLASFGNALVISCILISLLVTFCFVIGWMTSTPSQYPPRSIQLDRESPIEPHPFGLKELRPGTNPTIDIIAIHNVGGHREASWTANNGILWLQHSDFLPQRIPHARIMTFGYNTSQRDGQVSTSFLLENSKQLLTKLSLHRRLDRTEQRPIIFICHSFGGLLLKTALFDASNCHEAHLEDHRAIFNSTYGIAFLGTPQARLDDVRLAEYFLDLRGIFRPANDGLPRELNPSEPLRHQIEQYTAIQDQFKTCVFYEMCETPTRGRSKMIVERDSAFVAGTTNVPLVGLHKNHLTMTKFASPDDEDYKTVSSHLLLMARDAPDQISRVWSEQPVPLLAVSQRSTSKPQMVTSCVTKNLQSLPSASQYQARAFQAGKIAPFVNLEIRGSERLEVNVKVSEAGSATSCIAIEVTGVG